MLVTYKNNKDVLFEVFDVKYDSSGYPHFLIYKDGQWLCVSAKHFIPYIKKNESKITYKADGSLEFLAEEVVVEN